MLFCYELRAASKQASKVYVHEKIYDNKMTLSFLFMATGIP